MGQLTLALQANKELRKQFKPAPKPKKLSKKNQEIQDIIYGTDFGCKKDTVAKLISKVMGINLVKGKYREEDSFKTVKGSVLMRVGSDIGSGYKSHLGVDDSRNPYIMWNNTNNSSGRLFAFWRPATDKEIREYFS